MEFRDVLRRRFSVRSYADKELEPETVQQLLEQAALAPSAQNAQPWEFWVLLGRSEVQALSDRVQRWLVSQLKEDDSSGSLRDRLGDPAFNIFYGAAAVVLIVAHTKRMQDDEDCCLAGMTLMLSARDAGLGSCWIGLSRPWFNLASIKTELGIPQESNVVAPIVLGYPQAWPGEHERAAAKIHWLSPQS